MKNLITFSILVILCVSCASSRQELSFDKSTAISSKHIERNTDIIEELLAKLTAKFSDSIHIELECYYPPKNNSDSVGPVKSKLTYDKKTNSDVKKEEEKKTHKTDSIGIQHNDSTKNDVRVEEQKESSTFTFNLFHLFVVCLIALFLMWRFKR